MSYFESKALIEERGHVTEELQQLAVKVKAENRAMTPEELAHFDKLDSAQDEIRAKIESATRVEKADSFSITGDTVTTQLRAAVFGGPPEDTITVRDKDNAIRAWALTQSGNDHYMKDEYRAAAQKCGYSTDQQTKYLTLKNHGAKNVDQYRAGMKVSDDTMGGHATDDSVVQGIEEALLYHGGIRSVAKILRTENGNPIHWPTIDDTTNSGGLVTELTDVTSTDITLGRKTLNSYTYRTAIFPVSVELMLDSSIPIGAFIGEALGTRLARIQNTAFTTANGSSKPQGIIPAATVGVSADATSEVSYAELVDLYHSVDVAYRNNPSCGFMMSDDMLAYLKKLVDTTGRPLWQPGLVVGAADSILGKPYVVNSDMDDVDSTLQPIIFGDFSKFIIRDVADVQIMVLKERYAEKLAVAFMAFYRGDSELMQDKAVKTLQLA